MNDFHNLGKLETALGYTFQHKELLVRALTHSSYINEHNLTRLDCNERLEFLGDAVLELVSSSFLYDKYQDMPEGALTKMRASLVSEPPLAQKAVELGLGDWLRLARGAEDGGGRQQPSLLSDAVEAVIGAIYLDGGLECARAFILRHVLDRASEGVQIKDHKTKLQEIVQRNLGEEPVYELVSSAGPDHNRTFTSRVLVNGKELGCGSGHSKKQSEQAAAAQAVERLTENNSDVS